MLVNCKLNNKIKPIHFKNKKKEKEKEKRSLLKHKFFNLCNLIVSKFFRLTQLASLLDNI